VRYCLLPSIEKIVAGLQNFNMANYLDMQGPALINIVDYLHMQGLVL
jgi:hypothetical protein